MNWFDGVDFCKTRGAEIGKINWKYEEDFYRTYLSGVLLWIGYHGHKYQGNKFVWSDGSNDTFNKLDKKSLRKGLAAGLCVLVPNSNFTSWQRRICSERHRVLCSQPGKLTNAIEVFFFIKDRVFNISWAYVYNFYTII